MVLVRTEGGLRPAAQPFSFFEKERKTLTKKKEN